MPITGQIARDNFLLLKKDLIDVGVSTFVQWLDFINNYAYRKIAATDVERLSKTAPYTTSPNVASYTLPLDFRDVSEWDTGVFELDGNGNQTQRRLVVTGPGSQVRGYYIRQGMLVFTPVPVQSESFLMRYVPALAPITTYAGILCIPDEYLNYVLKALDVCYDQWDEDSTAEMGADHRFVNVMDEMILNIKQTPGVYDIPDTSDLF